MSERESKFIDNLKSVLGSFLLALVVGMFAFYRMTITSIAVQENRLTQIENKVETMRKESREDFNSLNTKIDTYIIKNNKNE